MENVTTYFPDGSTHTYHFWHKGPNDLEGTPRGTTYVGPMTVHSIDEPEEADMDFTLEEAEGEDNPASQPGGNDGTGVDGNAPLLCGGLFVCSESTARPGDITRDPGPDQGEDTAVVGAATPRLGLEAVTNPGDGSFIAGGGTGGGGGSLPDPCATVDGCGGDGPGPAR